MEGDGQLGDNFLLSMEGDAANVILAAADHNLRLLHTWSAWSFAFLLRLRAVPHPTGAARQPLAATA
jgi:hypothetical protein